MDYQLFTDTDTDITPEVAQKYNYFEEFANNSKYIVESAEILKETLGNYSQEKIKENKIAFIISIIFIISLVYYIILNICTKRNFQQKFLLFVNLKLYSITSLSKSSQKSVIYSSGISPASNDEIYPLNLGVI